MNHRSVDILVVTILTITAVTLAFILPPDWVPGRILTLPLVLVLPGYALTSALFPRLSLGVPERLVFSLGLSLAIVILGGLVLNLTPFGLHASSWAVLLGAITLGAGAVALMRRRRQSVPAPGWPGVGSLGFTFRQGLLLGLAVVIVGGAVAISIIGAERQPRSGFTQLWLLPADGTNATNAVRLGVHNQESTPMEYRLAVKVDGKVVKVWPAIDLNPNEQWQVTFPLPQSGHTGPAKVEAALYLTDAPGKIYHYVLLWLGT